MLKLKPRQNQSYEIRAITSEIFPDIKCTEHRENPSIVYKQNAGNNYTTPYVSNSCKCLHATFQLYDVDLHN